MEIGLNDAHFGKICSVIIKWTQNLDGPFNFQ